jgi:hypothetical protein
MQLKPMHVQDALCCQIKGSSIEHAITCTNQSHPSIQSIAMRNIFLVAVSTGLLLCQAFVPTTYSTSSRRGGIIIGNPGYTISSVLHAKQQRRRRRDPNAAEGADSIANGNSSGELPDFELDDDEEAESAAKKRKAISRNPDEITPAMMGSSNAPVGSIRDLLVDRSLESKLKFEEEEEDSSIPDLIAMSRSAQQDGAQTGTKKARQADRRAAAIEAKDADEKSFFTNLPFVSDEKGNFSTVKVRVRTAAN